jgi:hypothetical protein
VASEVPDLDVVEARLKYDNDLNYLARQCISDSAKYFPKFESEGSSSTGRLLHYAIGMSTEANEFLEIMKKVDRGSYDFNDEEGKIKALLEKEAVDTLIYVMNVFGEMGIDPLGAYHAKRNFNNERFSPKPPAEPSEEKLVRVPNPFGRGEVIPRG